MVDASDPEAPFAASFSSDGIYQDSDPEGAGLGAWEPTGPTSAALTIVIVSPAEDGGGMITIRATVEVAADGQTFTGDYTIEAGFEGAPPGEFGPGSVTGTRIVVEPMGTPVGSLDDLFGQFEGTVPLTPRPRIPRDRRRRHGHRDGDVDGHGDGDDDRRVAAASGVAVRPSAVEPCRLHARRPALPRGATAPHGRRQPKPAGRSSCRSRAAAGTTKRPNGSACSSALKRLPKHEELWSSSRREYA